MFNFTKIVAFMTSPIGIAILAIGALIAIGVLVWKNWDTIKAKAIEIWGAISNWFTSVWTSISTKATEVWGGLTTWLSSTWESIKTTVTTFLTDMATKFTNGWNAIKTKTAEIFNAIVDFIVEWAIKLFNMTPIGKFVNFIIKHWDFISKTTKIIFDMIVALIKVAFVLIMKVVTPIVEGLKSFLSKSWNFIKDTTSKVFNKVKDIFTTIWKNIVAFFKPIIEGIVNFLKQRWENLKNNTQSIFNSIKSVLTSVWNAIKSVVTSVATAIWNAVTDKFNAIKSTVTNIFNAVKSTVSSVWNSIKSKVTGVASDIWSSVKSTFNKIKSAMETPINKAKETIRKAVEAIKGFFSKMKLTIPKPKVPKVSVSTGHKTIAGIDVPYPKFSLHAKGGIFNGASMLGGNNVVGEAGSEVVMPVQHKRYMQPFAEAVADNMEEMSNGGGGNVTNNIEVAELVVREEADIERVAQRLYELQQRGKRQGGRR